MPDERAPLFPRRPARTPASACSSMKNEERENAARIFYSGPPPSSQRLFLIKFRAMLQQRPASNSLNLERSPSITAQRAIIRSSTELCLLCVNAVIARAACSTSAVGTRASRRLWNFYPMTRVRAFLCVSLSYI